MLSIHDVRGRPFLRLSQCCAFDDVFFQTSRWLPGYMPKVRQFQLSNGVKKCLLHSKFLQHSFICFSLRPQDLSESFRLEGIRCRSPRKLLQCPMSISIVVCNPQVLTAHVCLCRVNYHVSSTFEKVHPVDGPYVAEL